MGVKAFVCPHHGYKIFRFGKIDDVVRVAGEHMHRLDLLAADFKIQHLIQQRKIGSDEVLNFEVSGECIEAVHMLPGYTHNIINLSDTEDLVTLMWANECFDPGRPDTFFEPVE